MNFGIDAYSNWAQMNAGNASAAYAASRSQTDGATRTNGSASAVGVTSSKAQQAQLLKLKKAATQFEAMLLQKWWSSMKQSGLGQDDDIDPGAGTLDNMSMQAMSTAVANAGGVGIAAMLVRSLQGELAAENENKSSSAGAGQPRQNAPSRNQ